MWISQKRQRSEKSGQSGSALWTATLNVCVSIAMAMAMGVILTPVTWAGVAEEYQVKAAFFYHFARFIEWPAEKFHSDSESFRVCLVGKNPFQGALRKVLSDKTVHGRPFELLTNVSDSTLGQCHMVFVGQVADDRSQAVIQVLQGKGVLMIGEHAGFIHQGGIIRLFLDDSKVRFGINPQAARDAHLEISSKLLRLATIERS